MAKNGSKAIGWIRVAIMAAVILAGIFLAWGNLGIEAALHAEDIKDNVEDIAELEKDGCKPAQKNTTSLGLFEYRLNNLETGQTAIQADTKEILRRLPK